MRIDLIILHCAATKEGQNFDIRDIDRWHRQRGFNKVGYHYFIKLDGTIQVGRKENEIGAHCKGHNSNSIGICYCGGLDQDGNPKDTRTEAQKASIFKLLTELQERYPKARICGHNEFANKACPSFDVQKEYGYLND